MLFLGHFPVMENAFFCCHNLYMDILKLIDRLFDDEDLHDIPLEHIFRVAYAVLVLIAEGDCFYKVDFE